MAIGKSVSNLCNFIWNGKTKEFLGRDGASWAKICLFYGIFYVVLGGFFIGMLAVFRLTLDDVQPRYYDKTSTMGIAQNFETGKKSVNPALGFRPQIDPESSLILYSKSKLEEPDAFSDFVRLNKSLDAFFNRYYNYDDADLQIENCESKSIDDVRDELRKNKHCPFDYKKLIEKIQQTSPNDPFAYGTVGPLVVLKLNRIYNWLPKPLDMEKLPEFLHEYAKKDKKNQSAIQEIIENNVIVKCFGEYAADVDTLQRLNVKYYSIGIDANAYSNDFGILPFYYYPYLNQKNYQSPLVYVQFNSENATNVLTNVVCKAFAGNIDSDDKLNRRGMTQFNLYVKS